jgi:hypothetical protein
MQRLTEFVSSRRFFRLIVVVFVIEALWIALSGKYPMAFDEDFHLGIIRLYAHHLSPFWSGQPVGADAYGAVTRDPSYLFHYALSFPYRLISSLTTNQTIQVLVLRCINIALLATCLPLFRRLLTKAGSSAGLVNVCLALFVLVPVVPFLGAQINYDNVFIPLTALALLKTIQLGEQLRANHKLPLRSLLELAILMLLTSLVKYAFLPIALALTVYVGIDLYRHLQSRNPWRDVRHQFSGIPTTFRWLLVVGLIVSAGLFVERYGLNLVYYHKPVPDCGQVLTVKRCSTYGPWIRDYNLANAKTGNPGNPITFTGVWLYGMWMRSFFVVDGPSSQFQTRGPLVLPAITAALLAVTGVPLGLVYGRRLMRRYNQPLLSLFIAVISTYLVVLWVDAYEVFSRTGQPVAINGRYLLPVLLPLLLIVGLSYQEFLRHRSAVKTSLMIVAIAGFLWGGGALTYILRSNDDWYWSNPVVRSANHKLQRTLGPVTPGAARPIEFLR